MYPMSVNDNAAKSFHGLSNRQPDQSQYFSSSNGSLFKVLKSNPEKLATNDEMLNELLISKRGYHHLLYDEVMALIKQIESEFKNVLTLESIGKTYENRDIWMIKVDATEYFT
jgi:hypothetical protein